MTSDAKIGLLLGLVFIFAIAFLINGVPGFTRTTSGNNELTGNMVKLQRRPYSAWNRASSSQVRTLIGPASRRGGGEVAIVEQRESAGTESTAPSNQGVRYTASLPRSSAAAKDRSESKPSMTKSAQVYVVGSGDNLAVIAQKFYGSEQGNRQINISRIFEANRRVLKSPDEVYEGDKLVIPPLPSSAVRVAASAQVHSIYKNKPVAKPVGKYVVREDDSLWRIAAEKLGNGSRYVEIAKLNTDVLDDDDDLTVGMRLRLPGQ